MYGLTTIERLVLESLGQGPKEIPQLMADTRLELRFLANVLHALTLRGHIILVSNGYAINPRLPEEEKRALNSFEAKKEEAMELVGGLFNPGPSGIRLRKAWMSDKDRTMLRALLKGIEDFIQGLPSAPKDSATHAWSVVVWGEDRYGAIIDRLIKEA